MDETHTSTEPGSGFEFEEAVTWIFGVLGSLCLVGGLGLWSFTEMDLLWLPAVLAAAGLVLVVVPQVPHFFGDLNE